jgi:hypothetical protein
VVVIAGLNQPKPNPQVSNATTSLYVSCKIPAECGGKTITTTKDACSKSTCCPIGNQWVLKESTSECTTAQNAYSAYIIQLFSTPPAPPPTYNYYDTENYSGGSTCCKYCTTGKPCGDSCISVNKTCNVGPGCAC